jgi:hypothetical protein
MKSYYFQYHILISVFFICQVYSLHAQEQTLKISGLVFDENNKAVAYAHVLLLSMDSVYIDGTLTDTAGYFAIRASKGYHLLKVQSLGYKDVFYPFILTSADLTHDLHITERTIELSEVVITSQIPMVSREADRLIFDVAKIAAESSDGVDLLRKVPGVIIQHDDIKILGQQGVKVLINGKNQKMSGQELLMLLKTYQASQIDKIEVISIPPSQYDAEGSAGILNIRLKKIPNDFIGATLNYAYSYDKYHDNELNMGVNYNKKKLKTSLNANGFWSKTRYRESNIEDFGNFNKRGNTSDAVTDNHTYNLRGNMEYQFSERFSLGTFVTYNRSKNDRELHGKAIYYSGADHTTDSLLLSESSHELTNNSVRTNLYSDIVLDSIGKNLHVEMDYLHYDYDSYTLFNSKTYDVAEQYIGGQYRFNNDNTRDLNTFYSSFDFALPFRKYTINLGGKASFVETTNKTTYYNQPALEDQNDHFIFDEYIYALYADFSKELNKNLKFRTGLRYEHTYTKGDSENLRTGEHQIDENSYGRLFPAIYLGYKPDNSHQFNFSLSSRINRPSFRNINPFVLYTSKYTTVTGKPDLKPSYTYRMNCGYTFKGNLSFDLYYAYSNDGIRQITMSNSTTLISNTLWDNVLRTKTIGIDNSYLLSQFAWFQLFLIQGVSYTMSRSDSEYTLSKQNSLSYMAMANANFFFNKSRTFTGWVNAYYEAPQKTAIQDTYDQYNADMGLAYRLLNNKWRIALSVNNVIASHVRGHTNANNYRMDYDNTYSYPTIKLAVTYSIGAKISSRRYQNSDIQNRL